MVTCRLLGREPPGIRPCDPSGTLERQTVSTARNGIGSACLGDEWRIGPVAITGASGQVGTMLQERIAGRANRALPLNRGDDWAPAMRSAEIVLHLAGTLQPKGRNTYEAANVETTRAVARAVA